MAGSGSSQNGGVPPGFRFHPTDEELLLYYLTKKVSLEKFDLDVIREVDLNKIEPWDLQERCRIGATPQNEWYFFSHKDRKYPTGSRTNRATNAGFWKATGRDKCIRTSYKKIGMRKTLVFYRGRAPHGQKTDWIMHEYRLEESDDDQGGGNEDGWVVCRVFKKKCFFKTGSNEASSSLGGPSDTLMYMNTTNNCLDESRSLYLPQHFHPDLHPQPITSLYRPELALHYSNQLVTADVAYLNNAQQIQVQDLLPNHRTSPNGYEYHHASNIVDSCELQIHKHGEEDGREMNANDWAIINEQNVEGQMNQIVGQQQIRGGEMDLWGYGKD